MDGGGIRVTTKPGFIHDNLPEEATTTTTCSTSSTSSRRQAMVKLLGMTGSTLAAVWTGQVPTIAHADGVDVSTIAMKEFVDPYGLFSIQVPNEFYTLRRKAKGDLPDEKTGKGRRGSSIFTAGNMAKAEVIAVERYV